MQFQQKSPDGLGSYQATRFLKDNVLVVDNHLAIDSLSSLAYSILDIISNTTHLLFKKCIIFSKPSYGQGNFRKSFLKFNTVKKVIKLDQGS